MHRSRAAKWRKLFAAHFVEQSLRQTAPDLPPDLCHAFQPARGSLQLPFLLLWTPPQGFPTFCPTLLLDPGRSGAFPKACCVPGGQTRLQLPSAKSGCDDAHRPPEICPSSTSSPNAHHTAQKHQQQSRIRKPAPDLSAQVLRSVACHRRRAKEPSPRHRPPRSAGIHCGWGWAKS